MNTRLQDAYLVMRTENQEKFLRNDLALCDEWNTPVWGIVLQIDLGENVKKLIQTYQEELDEIEPDSLLSIPPSAQHVSVNQVVFWGGEYTDGQEKTWERIRDPFLMEFQKLDHLFPEFSVTFSGLVATTSGIVLCGYDNGDDLERLREEFLKKLPFPGETKKLNHIIHTTVVRYKERLRDPETVFQYLSAKQDTVTMRVRKIVLKKELVFPSLKTEMIGEIKLKSAS